MSVVEIIGWAGTVSGTILGLPQVMRLLRTGRVDGLSLPAWQAMLVVNLSWTAHGLSIGQLPQIVTSALSLCSTLPILYLMARELHRRVLLVLAPGLLAAGILVGVDQVLGVRRVRRGGDHSGRRLQRRSEPRAGPIAAHLGCLGDVLDTRRRESRSMAVLGHLGARHRHHHRGHGHGRHHGVQPDVVVSAHPGTGASTTADTT